MTDHLEGTVTPDEAVRRAVRIVKAPSMAALFAPLGVLVLLMELGAVPDEGTVGVIWFVATFVVAFGGAWIIWSVQVPRWRLWAYRAVEDVPALKRLAVQRQIIWPEGHFFEKTEFASSSLKEELRRLETEKRTSRAVAGGSSEAPR